MVLLGTLVGIYCLPGVAILAIVVPAQCECPRGPGRFGFLHVSTGGCHASLL